MNAYEHTIETLVEVFVVDARFREVSRVSNLGNEIRLTRR